MPKPINQETRPRERKQTITDIKSSEFINDISVMSPPNNETQTKNKPNSYCYMKLRQSFNILKMSRIINRTFQSCGLRFADIRFPLFFIRSMERVPGNIFFNQIFKVDLSPLWIENCITKKVLFGSNCPRFGPGSGRISTTSIWYAFPVCSAGI